KVGALYLRTDGASGTTLYTKTSGTGNTGWETLGSGLPNSIVKSSSAPTSSPVGSVYGNADTIATNAVPMVLTSYDPAKTYIAIFGNSIAVGTSTNYWSRMITNQWPNLALYTNYAVGGTDHQFSTNKYYSNALSVLPAQAINGTNVFIVFYDALLTFNSLVWTNSDQAIAAYTALASDVHSRGYKLVIPTTMPADYYPTVAQYDAFLPYNSWLLRSNVVDFVPDFFTTIPDCYDTNYIVDGVHPSTLGHSRLAMEFDDVVRLGSVRPPFWNHRVGTNWVIFNPNTKATVAYVNDGAFWNQLKVGFTNTQSLSGSKLIVGGGGFEPAAVIYGGNGQANNVAVFEAGSYAIPTAFRIWPDGSFSAGNDCSISGTLNISTGSAGTDFIKLVNVGGGKEYDIGSRATGIYQVRNKTIGADNFIISERPSAMSNSATNWIISLNLDEGIASGGTITYKIYVTDGTNIQMGSGVLTYALVNKAGTLTAALTDANPTKALSSGTLTWEFSVVQVGANVAFYCAPVSSLTPTTLNFRFSMDNQGTGAGLITIP
ncbi:MAG: SGNH/GDSL hydrolase family protein, partial [Pyrinomonadaceae bacterium]